MSSYYFAYGSNLLIEQMLARLGTIGSAEQAPRIARLGNHCLVFECPDGETQAFANIQSPGAGVLGVLYFLSEMHFAILDSFEDGYDRQTITVTDDQGESIAAIAYVIKPSQTVSAGMPDADYLARIIAGAMQHGLPELYLAENHQHGAARPTLRGCLGISQINGRRYNLCNYERAKLRVGRRQ